MRRAFLSLCIAMLPCATLAQETEAERSDRGRITAFIEDSLSGAGREVILRGFRGALSSRATAEELTIADDEGIWFTARDIVLDWNRTALLTGAVSVNSFTAAEIIFDRPPEAPPAPPTPEAGGFALPELPVSIQIGQITAARVILGEALLGQRVEGHVDASLSLSGGAGEVRILIERQDDGPDGQIRLGAAFDNTSRRLAIDLLAEEGPGGLAATLLGLPGEPAARLAVQGDGPLSDFTAEIALQTDGEDRLAGQVTLSAAAGPEAAGATDFAARLQGDLAPLFLPEYQDFFGPEVGLSAMGRRMANGALDLSELDLTTRSLALTGSLSLDADAVPRRFALSGRIEDPTGQAVILPARSPVQLMRGLLDLGYDAGVDETWRLNLRAEDLVLPEAALPQLALAGSGRMERRGAALFVGGTLAFSAADMALTDPALAEALGPELRGETRFWWETGAGRLNLGRLQISGAGVEALANAQIAGLSDGLRASGRVTADVADLARFSALTGRALGGAGRMELAGQGSPLGGDFDVTLALSGADLRLGLPELDSALAGQSRLDLAARRDATGTRLDRLSLVAPRVTAEGRALLASDRSEADLRFALPDLAPLRPGLGGAVSGQAQLRGAILQGQAEVTASLDARGLRVGQASADKLLAGNARLEGQVGLDQGQVRIRSLRLDNPQLAVSMRETAATVMEISARLQNLGLLLPEYPGPVTVQGSARLGGQGYAVDLNGTGPGQIDARLSGTIATDAARADLALTGTAQAGLANPFLGNRVVSGPLSADLRLNGPMQLSALTGRVSLSEGRLADPTLPFALERMAARADLAAGRAVLDVTAGISTGGSLRLRGGLGLAAPFAADLELDIAQAAIRDPQLYRTLVEGALRVTGPLTGGALVAGRLALGETELRLAATGFGASGDLPGLAHVNEPAAVRATRARAGLIAQEAEDAAPARPFGLDLVISAPNRLFLRGRGLDAELGGEIRIAGTTAAVVPSGAFDLIRGRLDILGRRLDLSEASLVLEGSFDPMLRIVATTDADGITAGVAITGPATNPEVAFTSTPQLPQEEVLAQILFGRRLENLSAIQALQLANAVATLAGRGGDGIVARLRQGFGLDDLDVQTGAEGGAQLRAGRYLSENVYSEVTIESTGKSEISLNLDLSDSVTVKSSVGADGNTGIGLFYERDY